MVVAEPPTSHTPPNTTGDHCLGPHAPSPMPPRAALAPDEVNALAEIFGVLSDPTRVRLLDILHEGEQCVCEIAATLGASESAVSHQLRLLRTLRLVTSRRSGRMVFYALDDHHIHALFRVGLEHVRERRPGASTHAPHGPRS